MIQASLTNGEALRAVCDDYGQNITVHKDIHLRNNFEGNTRKLLAVITL